MALDLLKPKIKMTIHYITVINMNHASYDYTTACGLKLKISDPEHSGRYPRSTFLKKAGKENQHCVDCYNSMDKKKLP